MSYITTTHLLERVHPDTPSITSEVRNAPEKLFVTEFADFTLTLIAMDPDLIRAFRDEHRTSS